MRDMALVAAGALAIVVAVCHAVLLERLVFPQMAAPPRLGRIIHAVCQMSTVDWIGIAVLLMAAPWFQSQTARSWVVGAAVVVYGVAAAGNLWATRRLHPGWVLMSGVVALAVVGL